MQVTFEQCSPMLMEAKVMKTLSVFWVAYAVKRKLECRKDNAYYFLGLQGYCSLWIHSTRPNSQLSLLCGNTEAVTWSCAWERPEIWPNDWILNHDNAPSHKVLSVRQFLAQKSITKMQHSPCSLDLAPNDFWLFHKIKSALKGWRFQDVEDIQKNMTTALKSVTQQEFQKVPTVAASLG